MLEKDTFLAHLYSERSKKTTVSHKTGEKLDLLIKELSNPLINLNKLRSLCFTGIPDEINGVRSIIWKLLLGYIPYNRSDWASVLESNRKIYWEFVEEFISSKKEKLDPSVIDYILNRDSPVKQSKKEFDGEEEKQIKKEKLASCVGVASLGIVKDHPLSKDPSSEWNSVFKDMFLWDEIEKDTKRTRTELDLFSKPTSKPLRKSFSRALTRSDPELHSDVLSRILFVYGKLNPGVRYVQGMNELLAPIYYCFVKDENPAFRDHAEADTFYCFSILMGDAKENFVKSLDTTDAGIQSRITDLNNLLKKVDKILWNHLNEEKVNPQFYTLRWIMLMLTQEFELLDVMRLWDSFFSHPNKLDFLNYCCLAMIINVRGAIINEEFPVIMENLQKNAASDVELILKRAIALYKQYSNPQEMSYIVFQ